MCLPDSQSPPVTSSSRVRHTDPFNLNPHIIPMIQNDLRIPHRPDPRRRPRHDQRSPLQRGPL